MGRSSKAYATHFPVSARPPLAQAFVPSVPIHCQVHRFSAGQIREIPAKIFGIFAGFRFPAHGRVGVRIAALGGLLELYSRYGPPDRSPSPTKAHSLA